MSRIPRTVAPCPKIEEDCYDWYRRHEAKCAAVLKEKYDIVFIGDSITHFFAGEDGPHNGTEIWDAFLAPRRALNLGFGFDRTQNMLWRIQHGELAGQSPRLFILNAGTNQFSVTERYSGDTGEDAAAGSIALIRALRERFPKAEFLVMAVFPRAPWKEFFEARIGVLNRIVREFAAQEEHVRFLDISDRLMNPDGTLKLEFFADQGCHPNREGYRIWYEAILPFLPEAEK